MSRTYIQEIQVIKANNVLNPLCYELDQVQGNEKHVMPLADTRHTTYLLILSVPECTRVAHQDHDLY